MIKHSIITWDNSFRNFFHLVDSLTQQQYDLNKVEVIFVEQRSEELAQQVADSAEVESIRQVSERLKDQLRLRLLYLDEPDDSPYHPGRLLNYGLRMAQGEILSTMDTDQLLVPNFLSTLEKVQDAGNVIAYMHRHAADRPCGVTVGNWTRQIVDYDLILGTCPDHHVAIPAKIVNRAPLISARRENWEIIEYYDDHRLFSTAYTLFGVDVSTRFSLLPGIAEISLPVVSVHPWHPNPLNRSKEPFQILYSTQMNLVKWSLDNQRFQLKDRLTLTNQIYEKNRSQIETAIRIAEDEMIQDARPKSMLIKPKIKEAHALNQKGETYFQSGDKSRAMAAFKHAIEIQPDNVTAINNLGVILWQNGENTKAVEYFNRALEIDPANEDANLNIAAALQSNDT